MEFVSAEASQAESGVNVTSQPGASSCDEDVDNERLDDGVFDYTNNNNNNNNNNNGESEKDQRPGDEMTVSDALPLSPASGDEQLTAARSVTSASPLTADSSPCDRNLSVADVGHSMETSTRPVYDCEYVDIDSSRRSDLVDRGSERSSAASDYSPPSNPCFSEAAAIYQQYATLKPSPPFRGSSMSSPVKGLAGLGSGVRCPPVREAVDPAKYITISGEPDGVKYACSKCGNIYKWRKSLNKHWKEKHDGETPDPAAASAAASRYVRMPTPVAAKRPSPSSFSAASSSATRFSGVRGSLAAILPPLPGRSGTGVGVTGNGRGWSQSASMTLQSPQLKTPTFADYKTSSAVTASPFSVLAVDSVLGKERPVDLSGSATRAHAVDDRLDDGGGVVLDLSKKGATPYASPSSLCVQDEPIDFSTKTASLSGRNPTYESEFYPVTMAGRPLEVAHAGSGGDAMMSLHCAQCRQKFTVPSRLNRHFADAHSDLLRMTAAATAADTVEASYGGSTQLYRYLTNEHATSRDAVRCVVCGASFFWRSAAAKHFEQEHVGLHPNPYQLAVGGDGNVGSSTQKRATSSVGHQLRCGRCSFTTDSFSVLARHHLRHSPRRQSDLMSADVSRILWDGAVGGPAHADDVKVSELQLLSGTAVSVDDVIGENTAIVIPQAPEDSTPSVAGSSSTPTSKPFKHTSTGARSSGGRGKRSDAGGSSTASAETLLPFKCQLCEYRARWPSEMTQHAKNHSDEKPYHCPQCTYRSKWKWDVVKHLKRCGGGGTARDVIDTTNSLSSSSSMPTAAAAGVSQTARRRRTNVRSLSIQPPSSYERIPGSVTAQPSAMTYALSSSVSSRQHLPNGTPNVAVCSRVQDSFADQSTGHGAVQTVADATTTSSQAKPAESITPTPPIVSLVNQGLHYCLQCSFVGHSPAELRRHLRVHSDEKPYSCRTCCYSSKWKCDLKKHLRAYNHVSAVPLAYGGHGRKPASDWQSAKDGHRDIAAADELTEPTDVDEYRAAETPDSGSQPGAVSSLKSDVKSGVPTKTQRLPNGSNFAGITVGGRLRCRRCDFEAIDLTSFLQHKSTHAAIRKDENSDTGDQPELHAPAAAAAARPSHHRRKSSKQVRVVPESKTEKHVKATPVDDHGVVVDEVKLASDDQVNAADGVDGSKFWTSLGLRSKAEVSCLQSAEAVDVNGSSLLDVTVDARPGELNTTVTDAEWESDRSGCLTVDEMADVVADAVMSSPASSSDTDVEVIDVDQPVDLCRRRVPPDDPRLDTDTVVEPVASHAARQTWNAAERITTTEADDATGMSKRKRRLRACDKCGYVTDNLTTLQRHAAKHGSAGRHRCTQCDYTVDRQHILDYHVKNVHVSGVAAAPSVDDQKTTAERFQKDEARRSTDAVPAVKRGRMQRPDADHVMAAYRCISCGYSGHSVAAMARHRLGHSAWSLPYRCRQCPHRSTTRRLLTRHARKHDRTSSCSDATSSTCRYCPYESSLASDVADHERFHGAVRHYRCPHCSYSVDRRSLFVQHRRVHASDCLRLRCRHADCPFICHSRDQLTSHGRQHAGPGRRRPFACGRCSFAVGSRNAMSHHRRLHDRRQ